MKEFFEQNKPKVIGVFAVLIVFVFGYFWQDSNQTKEYIQSIQYDVQSLNQSRATLESYEKGGMTFAAFFDNNEKVNREITKAKEVISRSMPKNNTSHEIKKAALDYADGVAKMCESANDWRDYEMRNKYDKVGIEKVEKNYNDNKKEALVKLNNYTNLVK